MKFFLFLARFNKPISIRTFVARYLKIGEKVKADFFSFHSNHTYKFLLVTWRIASAELEFTAQLFVYKWQADDWRSIQYVDKS